MLEDVVVKSSSYTLLSENFEKFSEKIKEEESEDGRSLIGLEEDLSKLLSPWGAKFQLEMRSPSVSEIIKTLLKYECLDIEHGKPQTADQFGSKGFQRHFIYSLIQLGAKYAT